MGPKHPIMRTTLTLFATSAVIAVQAQLFNGSFESGGLPSLSLWESTCSTPGLLNDGAPGAGSWSATKEAGQTQGCFPSYLYQRLSGVTNGQLVTLSGWVRCDSTPPCLGAHISLGTVNSGNFSLEEQIGTSSSAWTFVTITDTVQIGVGDTAILVLNAGLIGGPINPTPGHFDGLSIDAPTAVSDPMQREVQSFFDAANDRMTVTTGGPALGGVRLFDALGRELQLHDVQRERAQLTFSTIALGTGVYLVQIHSEGVEQVVRFVKR